MPLRIRWKSKEFLPYSLLIFGACGMFQLFYIFAAQYFMNIGNYVVVVLIPIAITAALFYASKIMFESFAQVERRKKIKTQFKYSKRPDSTIKRFFIFPIVKPLIIMFAIFTGIFIASYMITIIFLSSMYSFLLAENISGVSCLIFANYFEINYAKVRKL